MTSAPRFVLPGKWGRINLGSEAATTRSIKKVLDDATNRRDDMAAARAELRGRFEKAAETAKLGGATDFHVAFHLTPSVPLPAWVAVFTPEIDSTDFTALGLPELQRFLEAGTSTWGSDEATRSAITVEHGGEKIIAVRHAWRRVHDVVEGEVERRFEFIEADYWIAAQQPNRIALLTFSTALAEYETEMLGLFDAIVHTIRWPAGDRTVGAAANG